MPTNLDALLRYHVIDQCLQNHYRTWTWQDLADKCTDALLEAKYRPMKVGISKRTIDNDVRVMRSNILGYNAPILIKKGLYSYNEKDFLIRNLTLSNQDIQNISAAIKLFKTYKGIEFFSEVESLLNRLEKKVHIKTFQQVQNIISFEQIPASSGQEWLNPLMQAILQKQVLQLNYKKFNSTVAKEYVYHPYFLKEYRNKWYILGWFEPGNCIKTFALDRIDTFRVDTSLNYIEKNIPSAEVYFKNTIGVTLNNSDPETIILEFNGALAPYLKSQPLHESQQIQIETDTTIVICLKLTINYELESLILSYGNDVKVLDPKSLAIRLKERIAVDR